MNVLVLLRVGRDPASFTVNRKAQRIFVHRDEWRTNPSDLNALEGALQLGDQGHSVIAVAVGGGDESAVALREARAMGAARAVWVTDEALKDADAGQIVAVLPKVIEHVGGADLMLVGADVQHADLAQVGPRLAAALGWPLMEAAYAVQLDSSSATVTATVVGGEGYALVRTALPAVATVAHDANQPRYAPAASIIHVHAAPTAVEQLSTTALGLDAAGLKPLVARRGEAYSPERVFGQLIEADVDEASVIFAAALNGER